MTKLDHPDESGDAPHAGLPSRLVRAKPVTAVRRRYQRSMARELGRQLSALDFANQATLLGSGLLASLIPLLILLSAFANARVDDDIALRLGLNPRAAHIVSHLFHSSPASLSAATTISFIFVAAGTVAVASSLQQVYEKAFRQPHRGVSDLPRLLIWVPALCGVISLESVLGRAVRDVWGGRTLLAVLAFALLGPFFWWTMHFMLGGRVPWRRLVPSAVITAGLWAGLGVVSELYFSATIISDSRTFGAIGAVFSLLTWLIAIGCVLILGPLAGAIWLERRSPAAP